MDQTQQNTQFIEGMRIQEQIAAARALKGTIINSMLINAPTGAFLLEIEIQARTLLQWIDNQKEAPDAPPRV